MCTDHTVCPSIPGRTSASGPWESHCRPRTLLFWATPSGCRVEGPLQERTAVRGTPGTCEGVERSCSGDPVRHHDPPLPSGLSRDPSEWRPLTPDTRPSCHQVTERVAQAVEQHRRPLSPVAPQLEGCTSGSCGRSAAVADSRSAGAPGEGGSREPPARGHGVPDAWMCSLGLK